MMTTPSVETTDPPPQDEPAEIYAWRTEGYRMWLVDAGDDGATIMCNAEDGVPQEFGTITYDAVKARHVIEWNHDGCLAIESYKRDHWDSKFYYTMAAWVAQ